MYKKENMSHIYVYIVPLFQLKMNLIKCHYCLPLIFQYISIKYAPPDLYHKLNVTFVMKHKHNNAEIFNRAFNRTFCLIYKIATKKHVTLTIRAKCKVPKLVSFYLKPKKATFKYSLLFSKNKMVRIH